MSDDQTAVIESLRKRLAEVEDTIRAIREGEVDALVVGQPESKQVFSIGGDPESYRQFMEAMEPAAAALDDKRRVVFANSKLAGLFGLELNQVRGRAIADLLHGFNGSKLVHLIEAVDDPDAAAEMQINQADGPHYFSTSAKRLQLGTTNGFAITFSDITEKKRAEAAQENERLARAVIASANEAVMVVDLDGVITHANAAAQSIHEKEVIGLSFASEFPLVFPDATGLMQSGDLVQMAADGNSIQGIEALFPNAPRVKDYLVSAAPLRVANDAIVGSVVTMVDLSQRKAAEKQQLLLMRELDHRVKNTLALVLSISSRSASGEETLEGFQKSFTGRIQALAATHTLLADNSWKDLSLKDIVAAEVAPYIGEATDRVEFAGLNISVLPRAAVAFGLVIHELVTNAVKYGALSVPKGRVRVIEDASLDSSQPLGITWEESGGPPVREPTRKGFGRTVIARSLQYTPEGGATIEFAPEGVVARIRVPREDIQEA